MPEFETFDLPELDTSDEPEFDWDPCWELDDEEQQPPTALSSEPRQRKWMLIGTGLCGLLTAVAVTWLTAGPRTEVEAAPPEQPSAVSAIVEAPRTRALVEIPELVDELDGLNLASALEEPEATTRRFRAPPPPPLRESTPAMASVAPTPAAATTTAQSVTPSESSAVEPSAVEPSAVEPEPSDAAPSTDAVVEGPDLISLDELPGLDDLPAPDDEASDAEPALPGATF